MNTMKKITLCLFAVVLAAALVFAGCGSDLTIGPEGDAETAAGPEAGPAPETGKDTKETAPEFGAEYSADGVVTSMAGGVVVSRIESKIYNSDTATRTETDMPMMGVATDGPTISMIIIDRRDLGVSWQLFPKSKKYIENKTVTDPSEGMPTMNLHDIIYSGDYKMEKVGTEEVNGYECDKYILNPNTPTLSNITIWSAKKLDGVIIKTLVEMSEGSSMTNELFNVKAGRPDASLFEVPGDYMKATEAEIGMLMMQEMSGQ